MKGNLLNQGNQAKQRNGLELKSNKICTIILIKACQRCSSDDSESHADNGAVCNLIFGKIGRMSDTVARKIPSKKQDKQLKSILLTVKIVQKTRNQKENSTQIGKEKIDFELFVFTELATKLASDRLLASFEHLIQQIFQRRQVLG
ncbi:MAG: hypothetical protein ACLUCE_06485 [Streptococcus sp.]|uniref:hypothetical protein n=1 Tax=Streptococcus sp. TaxID=1306 RepID=UPI003991BC62